MFSPDLMQDLFKKAKSKDRSIRSELKNRIDNLSKNIPNDLVMKNK
jgi:hypothetical protein